MRIEKEIRDRKHRLREVQAIIQGKKFTFDSKNGQVLLQKNVTVEKLPETNLKLPFSLKKKKQL